MIISRAWAMPSPATFTIPPIAELLDRWLHGEVVDPFAGNSTRAQWSNDLNPITFSLCHESADTFCERMCDVGVSADCVLFDPPYSPRQISEVYKSIGRSVSTADTQNAHLYKTVRDGLHRLTHVGSLALSFGWNSAGFGKSRGYEIEEILLVAHGGTHNDTICTVEKRVR